MNTSRAPLNTSLSKGMAALLIRTDWQGPATPLKRCRAQSRQQHQAQTQGTCSCTLDWMVGYHNAQVATCATPCCSSDDPALRVSSAPSPSSKFTTGCCHAISCVYTLTHLLGRHGIRPHDQRRIRPLLKVRQVRQRVLIVLLHSIIIIQGITRLCCARCFAVGCGLPLRPCM